LVEKSQPSAHGKKEGGEKTVFKDVRENKSTSVSLGEKQRRGKTGLVSLGGKWKRK